MRRAALLAPLLAAMIAATVSAPQASSGPLASPGSPARTPPVAPGAAAKGETDGSSSDGPLQIFSDDNLEWTKVSKDEDLIVARGNAKAIRGNMVVTADVLLAHTRPKAPQPNQPTPDTAKQSGKDTAKDSAKDASDPSGGKEIWRVEAQGHVIIASPVESPTKRAYGDYADYNVDQKVVVLTGKDLRIVTPTDIITARDSLEYWQATDQAVGRGNAVAVRPEKQERIQADVLQAEFVDTDKKQKDLQVAHGFGHVVLTTPTEVVTGDRSDYFVDTGIVTVTGVVKLTKGDNLTEGCYAVVNQKTGISRVYPAPPGKPIPDAGCQVRALLVSQKGTKPDSDKTQSSKTDTTKPAAGPAAAPIATPPGAGTP